MSNDKWRFLEAALERLEGALRPRGLDTLLIDRLEAAVSSADRARVEETRDLISNFADRVRRLLPDEAIKQLHAPDELAALALVYEIGQIDFADHFASRVAQRRVPDVFMQALMDKKYEPILQQLSLAERSGVDLARRTDRAEETISRALGELRELGIVDGRREGRKIINFLTPAAKAAFATVTTRPTTREMMRDAVRKSIEEQKQDLAPYLRAKVIFEEEDIASPVS